VSQWKCSVWAFLARIRPNRLFNGQTGRNFLRLQFILTNFDVCYVAKGDIIFYYQWPEIYTNLELSYATNDDMTSDGK